MGVSMTPIIFANRGVMLLVTIQTPQEACKGLSDPGPSTYFLLVIGPHAWTLSQLDLPYTYIPYNLSPYWYSPLAR
jgi:hypothetical protein